MHLLAQGLNRKEIALRLHVTVSTVRAHLHTAYPKLGAATGAHAVAVAFSAGWVDPVNTHLGDNRLTAAQHLYLAAFTRWLRDPTDESGEERQHWFRGLYYEAHKRPPWRERPERTACPPPRYSQSHSRPRASQHANTAPSRKH